MGVEYCPPFPFNPALTFWVGTVATRIVCGLGLIGNTLVLAVYTQRKHQFTAEGILLTCLGLADSFQLICGFLIISLRYVFPYTGDMRYYYEVTSSFITVVVQPLWYMAQSFAAYLILMLSFCRWAVVTRRYQRFLDERHTWNAVGANFLLSILFAMPRFFEATVQMLPLPPECSMFYGQMRWTLVYRNISYTGWYVLWYQKIAFNIFVYCIPAAGILVLNALTGWRLWTMPREGSGKKDQMHLTIMIFATGFAWVILTAPISILWYPATATVNIYHWELISTLCLLTLCSLNLVMYYAIGEDFRKELWLSLRALRIGNAEYPEVSATRISTTRYVIKPAFEPTHAAGSNRYRTKLED